jgi:hypothetical protein
MSSRHPPATDPLEADIERALLPGHFIPHRNCDGFLDGLGEIEGRIASLIPWGFVAGGNAR